jgi:hypothetical protein
VINPSARDVRPLAKDIERTSVASWPSGHIEPNKRPAALLGPSFPMWAR